MKKDTENCCKLESLRFAEMETNTGQGGPLSLWSSGTWLDAKLWRRYQGSYSTVAKEQGSGCPQPVGAEDPIDWCTGSTQDKYKQGVLR